MSANRSSWLTFAQRSRDEGGLGLAPHQAAGVVGNLVHESGQDLNPWGPTGDNGSAWGTAQWRLDRLDRLKQRPDHQTMEGQQAFMREEMDGTESKAYRALQAAKTPEEAAHAFDAMYERSDGATRDKRMASAREIAGGSASSFAPTQESKSMPALSADTTMGPGALSEAYPGDRFADGLIGVGASLAGISNPDQARAMAAMLAANQKTASDKGSWSSAFAPNGQIVQTHNKTGQTRVVGGSYAKPEENTYNVAADKGAADDNIKLGAKISDAASAAMAAQTDFAVLDKALKNPDVGQGLTGPVRNFMNKAYVAFGIGDAATAAAAADGDMINSLGPKMALQVVQNGGDKLLPGSMSDSDLKLVTRFGNGDKLEPAANRQLLEAAIKHNARVIEVDGIRQKAMADNGGRMPQDFRNQLTELRKRWSEEDIARAASAPPAAAATQGATPQQPNSGSFKSKSGKTLNFSY